MDAGGSRVTVDRRGDAGVVHYGVGPYAMTLTLLPPLPLPLDAKKVSKDDCEKAGEGGGKG